MHAQLPNRQRHTTRHRNLVHSSVTSACCARKPYQLSRKPNWTWRSKCEAQRYVLSYASQGSSESTIKSLESLLGSQDSIDEGEKKLRPRDDRRRKVPDAAERRVRPLYVYVIYYCFIIVYLSAAWLQATDGDLAASRLIDQLVNDHLAVASGDVQRLATAGFVCEGPLMLFMQLATLLTVGAEAEALLGYSLFWAVYWLANIGGGLADAALSELPVTFGPANAAAGIVGALVAFYARNLGLDERIAAARRAVRQRRQQILDGVGSGTEKPVSASRDSLEDADAEVEVLPLMSLTFRARLSVEARGLLSVLVALVVAGQGLLELGGASSSASWIGLISAFWTGLVLTYWTGPQYEVQYKLPTVQDEDGSQAAAGPNGDDAESSAGGLSSSLQILEERFQTSGRRGPDSDGLMVVDVCPLPRRQLVLGGYVAGLAATICGWLAWMGTDL